MRAPGAGELQEQKHAKVVRFNKELVTWQDLNITFYVGGRNYSTVAQGGTGILKVPLDASLRAEVPAWLRYIERALPFLMVPIYCVSKSKEFSAVSSGMFESYLYITFSRARKPSSYRSEGFIILVFLPSGCAWERRQVKRHGSPRPSATDGQHNQRKLGKP